MFETTIAGSLPKPSWLATPNVLWAPWTLTGAPLQEAKEDATALSIKRQEDAGIDIVSDGEQARQHFVHGFLAEIDGVDFDRKVRMGIRNNRYDADCPTVTSALKRRKFVHEKEAHVARATTARKLKFTLPGPMTLIDTLADGYYGDRVKMAFAFAELLNQEAKDLEKLGVDVVQFDEPAFNVYLNETVDWGVPALEKAAEGLKCATAVHICYGYGIEANIKWKETLGENWRQYENTFPALDRSRIDRAVRRATVELLGEVGYTELTMAAVASRAGSTTPALYRRFSSKAGWIWLAGRMKPPSRAVAGRSSTVMKTLCICGGTPVPP